MLLPENLKQFVERRWSNNSLRPFGLLTKCPLCDSRDLRLLFTKWEFDHLECNKCDLVFVAQEPTPEFLADLYENLDYFTAKIRFVEKPRLERGDTFNFTLNVTEWYQSIIDRILPWHQEGSWLDVGGGTGRFMQFVREYAPGFETYLCESNKLAGQLAEQYCSARLISWEELEDTHNSFQVITCIAVFEHIAASVEFIRKLTKLLVPGGILYMTMPRLGPLGRRISKTALYDIAPPAHLRFFSDKSLRYLESCLNGELHLTQLHQSHGKTFHLGHLYNPKWYQYIDVVPSSESEFPSRVVVASPATLFEKIIFRLLSMGDWLLAPVFQAIDGQRVLHAIWVKS